MVIQYLSITELKDIIAQEWSVLPLNKKPVFNVANDFGFDFSQLYFERF